MTNPNGRDMPQPIVIAPAMLADTMRQAFELATLHGGCPFRDAAPPSVSLSPEIDHEVVRHRARWSEASPAVRATAAVLLALEGMPTAIP